MKVKPLPPAHAQVCNCDDEDGSMGIRYPHEPGPDTCYVCMLAWNVDDRDARIAELEADLDKANTAMCLTDAAAGKTLDEVSAKRDAAVKRAEEAEAALGLIVDGVGKCDLPRPLDPHATLGWLCAEIEHREATSYARGRSDQVGMPPPDLVSDECPGRESRPLCASTGCWHCAVAEWEAAEQREAAALASLEALRAIWSDADTAHDLEEWELGDIINAGQKTVDALAITTEGAGKARTVTEDNGGSDGG